MKILITGNMGYIGPVLVLHLRRKFPDAVLFGLDVGFFGHCLTGAGELPERRIHHQVFRDIRDVSEDDFAGVDGVVHLAAVSNDPMGNRFESITREINESSSVRIAKLAIDAGVRHFVFASSCSIYGAAESAPRKESDSLNPLTAYARSKVGTEEGLAYLASTSDAVVTSLRFATACGMSDRLRLDLVLNDFVACAVSTGQISVLSDGTPWRPLIDVKDMAHAIEWALTRTADVGGKYVAVNVGADEGNYRVGELAAAVAKVIPGTRVSINDKAQSDKRSYRVNFSNYKRLAPRHQPQVGLEQTINELKSGLNRMEFRDSNFRSSNFMRLKVLESHISDGRMTSDLRWTVSSS
jgi:nucleoside-diphosphate-sugar epimerase